MDWTNYGSGIGAGATAPGYTTAYAGTGAISLNPNSFQYVQITNVYLSQQSFTIETWVYFAPSNITGEYGIFGLCDTNLLCLMISLRNGRITLSFDSMNTNSTLTGSTILTTSDWSHVTVVYDATLSQQQIYYNGILDAISTGTVSSYQGASAPMATIGKTVSLAYGTTYFYG